MICLGLESSHQGFSIALSDQDRVIGYRTYRQTRMVDQKIILAIRQLLTKHKMTLDDVDVFAIDQGPGSFTGVRVGLSTIKGLAFGRNIKIVAIPSLMIIAYHCAQDYSGSLCVINDARRSLLYAGFFECVNGEPSLKKKYHLAELKQVIKMCSNSIMFVGDGVSLYEKQLRQNLTSTMTIADKKYWYSHARYLVMAAQHYIRRHEWQDMTTVLPIYLYPEYCQINK